MEFLLSKLLPMMVYPLGLAMILIFFALILIALHRSRLASLLLVTSICILWVSSTPVFSDFIRKPLEQQYPYVSVEDLPSADVIIVLGGGTGNVSWGGSVNLQDASDRVFHGARLYKAGKAPVILLAGGGAPDGWPESMIMAALLVEQGISKEDLLEEQISVNTRQNAVNSLALMKREGFEKVLLVTSAVHMRRAMAVFQKLGIKVIPAATDYKVLPAYLSVLDWFPAADSLSETTAGIKEYLAFMVYRIRDWV